MTILKNEEIEYEQANELFRHYHTLQWMSGTVFISTAFAILGLTWEIREPLALCLYASVSVSLYSIWLIIQERYQDYVDIVRKRIMELEKLMGLDLHLQIKEEDEKKLKERPIRHSLKRMRYMTRYIIPLFLLLLWGFRLVLALTS